MNDDHLRQRYPELAELVDGPAFTAIAIAFQAKDREIDRLRAEVARLRAGESEQPPAEGVQLTPAEWIRTWNDATAERRLEWAVRVLDNSAGVSRCFVLDHEGRMQDLAQAQTAISRVRADCEAQRRECAGDVSRDCSRGGIWAQATRTLNILDRPPETISE